jgi:hypothetical protein
VIIPAEIYIYSFVLVVLGLHLGLSHLWKVLYLLSHASSLVRIFEAKIEKTHLGVSVVKGMRGNWCGWSSVTIMKGYLSALCCFSKTEKILMLEVFNQSFLPVFHSAHRNNNFTGFLLPSGIWSRQYSLCHLRKSERGSLWKRHLWVLPAVYVRVGNCM